MSKRLSVVLMSIILAVIICLSVFAFLPDDLDWGAYRVLHAPIHLIDKGTDFGDTIVTTYYFPQDELEDDFYAEQKEDIIEIVAKRFNNFGLYEYELEWVSDNEFVVEIPEIEDSSIYLDCISSCGVIEILMTETYAENSVNLNNKDFVSATKEHYSYNTSSYWILKLKVDSTAERRLRQLTGATTLYIALNGEHENLAAISTQVNPATNELYIYLDDSSEYVVDEIINWVKSGYYYSNLISIDTENVEYQGSFALIISLVVLALILAVAVVLILRYKVLGIAATLAIATVLVAELYFAAFVYFSILNIWAIVGVVISIAVAAYLSVDSFAKIQESYATGKTVKSSISTGFNKALIKNAIVNGATLVVGIILWLIPTSVTAYMGIALVYGAVASAIATLGLNRLYANILYPVKEEENECYGLKA